MEKFLKTLRVSMNQLPGAQSAMQALILPWLQECKRGGLEGYTITPAAIFDDKRAGFLWIFTDKESYDIEVKQFKCETKPAKIAYNIPFLKRTIALTVEKWDKPI